MLVHWKKSQAISSIPRHIPAAKSVVFAACVAA